MLTAAPRHAFANSAAAEDVVQCTNSALAVQRTNSALAAAASMAANVAALQLLNQPQVWPSQAVLPQNAAAATKHRGIFEMREYTLKPEAFKEYFAVTNAKLDVRLEILPFLGMFTCDAGGAANRALHIYHYDDFAQRDRQREIMRSSPAWNDGYLTLSRPCVSHQASDLFEPAAGVMAAAGSVPVQEFNAPPRQPGELPVYVLKQFYMKPTPGAAATFLREYEAGMPARLAADGSGTLVFMGASIYSDPQGRVLEWWRYPSAAAAYEAERAAAASPAWAIRQTAAMAVVERATSSLLHACKFSPWK